ncbi:MAG: hypothetical protein DMD94_24820 [Candidatus Rokuibacteriota bacterium]|nr:MAG: hypothetical protein DMD94_24820 [Candidatus Rokubacteria bacterium]
MMRRLIVNADDFGLAPQVSAGILTAHRHGIVSSTTALVTVAIDDDSVGALRDSGLGVGLHVNLTLGRPLSGGRSLVDAKGRFVRDGRHAVARADGRDVAREVSAQIQDESARARARSAGLRTPDHFFGESGPGPYWSLARTLAHLKTLPLGVSEFMAHPGWFDDELAYSRYGRQRETEMVGLGTPAARAAVESLGIRLCHFGVL